MIFNDGQSEILQSAQLGVSYNKDNSLNQLMKNQNKWAWFIGYFKNEKNTLTDLIQISDENLTNGIASMEHAKEEPKQQSRKLKQAFYDSNTNYSSFLS